MLNHTMSAFISCMIGKKIGTMMTTIGTHSSGQPRTKHTTKIARTRNVGEMSQATSVLAMSKAGRRKHCSHESRSGEQDHDHARSLHGAEHRVLEHSPREPPCCRHDQRTDATDGSSVGVAQPETIEPSVARINAAGGIRPKNSSRKSTLAGTSSSDHSGGPSFGLSRTRTRVYSRYSPASSNPGSAPNKAAPPRLGVPVPLLPASRSEDQDAERATGADRPGREPDVITGFQHHRCGH